MSEQGPPDNPVVLMQPELLASFISDRVESIMRRRIDADPLKLDEICLAAAHSAHVAVLQVGAAARRLGPDDPVAEMRQWLAAEKIADAERAGEPPLPSQPVGPPPASAAFTEAKWGHLETHVTAERRPTARQLVSILVALGLAKAARRVLDWGRHDG